MAEVKWIKLTTDIFDDEKILMIESLPSADTIIVIWFKLLAFAGKSNNNGVVMMNNRIPYTEDMLAAIFRRDSKTVSLALKTFEQFGMIEIIDNVITIPNWDKHQTLDAYEKKKERDRKLQAERRARQKALIEKSPDNRLTSGDSQLTVAVSEEEIEEEKEKEEEYHSFIHSDVREEEKMKYMEGKLGEGLVLMSEEQFHDLLDKLSFDELHKYFAIIVECEKNGKRYKKKSHYQAILDMAAKDRKVSL
jgi:predicted phage replisome organizer